MAGGDQADCPGVTRVVALLQVETAANAGFLRAAQSAASSLGVTLTGTSVHNASEIETALMALSAEVNCGLIVMPHPVTTANRELILKMAAQYRLPAVYPFRYYTAAGGLMSYGIDLVDLFRRAATMSTAFCEVSSRENCRCRHRANSRW